LNKVPYDKVEQHSQQDLLQRLADYTDDFSGADCMRLVQEAARLCLRESIREDLPADTLHLTERHFIEALELCKYS
jgi:SpoVK/Ycf46/Vps4 family AAA+-type ATPase